MHGGEILPFIHCSFSHYCYYFFFTVVVVVSCRMIALRDMCALDSHSKNRFFSMQYWNSLNPCFFYLFPIEANILSFFHYFIILHVLIYTFIIFLRFWKKRKYDVNIFLEYKNYSFFKLNLVYYHKRMHFFINQL